MAGYANPNRDEYGQAAQSLIVRQCNLVFELASRPDCSGAAKAYSRWQRMQQVVGSSPPPISDRRDMSRSIAALATAHASVSDLPEAIRWLDECHALLPATESLESSLHLARSDAEVIEVYSQAQRIELGRTHRPNELVRSIENRLQHTDGELEYPWWLRDLHHSTHEFVLNLIDSNRLTDALAWLRHSRWYRGIFPYAPESGREACQSAAWCACKLAKQYIRLKRHETALEVTREGLESLDGHLAAGGDDSYALQDELTQLASDTLGELAEISASRDDINAAFSMWEDAWLAKLQHSDRGECDSSRIVSGMQKCLAPEVRSIHDPRLLAALELLRARQSEADTPVLRDFYRIVQIRIRVDLLQTYDEDEARERIPDVLRLAEEFRAMDSDELRDAELKHVAEQLPTVFGDDSVFRAVCAQVRSNETRYQLLILQLSHKSSDGEWERFVPLAEEALDIWCKGPLVLMHLYRLDELATELNKAIDKAVDDLNLDWAIEQLPLLDRLSYVRQGFAQQVPLIDEEDRLRDYSQCKMAALARIAVGYSRCSDGNSHQLAEEYIHRVEAVSTAEVELDDFLIMDISEVQANIVAKQLPELEHDEARRRIAAIRYEPFRHWLLHLLAIRIVESGNITLAAELRGEMDTIEETGTLRDTRRNLNERAHVEAAIASASLKAGDPEGFLRWMIDFEASLMKADVECDWQGNNAIESEIAGRTHIVKAAIRCRRIVHGVSQILKAIRSVQRHTDAEWRGDQWYTIVYWLTCISEELIDRGPWGKGVARSILDWQRELLPRIGPTGAREDQMTWLAYLYGELGDITAQRTLLHGIESDQMRVYSAPILAACLAAEGAFEQAAATLMSARQEADRVDPKSEIPWLRGLFPLGESLVMARRIVEEPVSLEAWLESVTEPADRVAALARMGHALFCLHRGNEAQDLFQRAIELLETVETGSRDDSRGQLSSVMRAASLNVSVVDEVGAADKIIRMIPDDRLRREAELLRAAIAEQLQLSASGAMQTTHANPLPVLAAADVATLPDDDVCRLVPAESKLLNQVEQLRQSPEDGPRLAELWSRIDDEITHAWLGPVAEPKLKC